MDKFYPPEEINDQLIRNCELDTRAVLGDACTILAAFLVLEDRKLQAILQLRKGWQTYQEANKIIDKSREILVHFGGSSDPFCSFIER